MTTKTRRVKGKPSSDAGVVGAEAGVSEFTYVRVSADEPPVLRKVTLEGKLISEVERRPITVAPAPVVVKEHASLQS